MTGLKTRIISTTSIPIFMSVPSDRLTRVTDIAHSTALLEIFVQERLIRLDNISVPVTTSGVLRHPANDPPTTVPVDVVAVLIKQRRVPATIVVRGVDTGFVVTESRSSKPEEFYVLFVNCGEGRRCTIEGTMEVRYFHPRDGAARATFFAAYYS